MIRTLLVSSYLFFLSIFLPVNAQPLLVGGSGTDLGTFEILAKAFNKNNPGIEIKVLPSMGSSGGIKALKSGRLDLALTARPLKPVEKSSDISFIYYASTPLVFAVADSSLQEGLSRKQVNQIFTGELKHWPDGRPLRTILRPSHDSDTLILLDTLIDCESCFKQLYQQRGIPVAVTDQESAEMIARVPGAIGTSTLALILSEKKPLKALMLDGILPTAASLSSQSYPMYKNLYLVYRSQHKNKNLQAFIDFISTDTGQSILLKTGHLSKL